MNGNKLNTEAADSTALYPGYFCTIEVFEVQRRRVVAERSCQRRSDTVTSRGAATSDYAGMSNDKAGENPARRKPKVSWGR